MSVRAGCGAGSRPGDGVQRPWGRAIAGALLAGLGGCAPAVPYPAGLKADDASTRIRAIKMAGDRRDSSAMPLLIDRLDDEDSAVRLFAIVALEKITGTRLGYDYAKPAAERSRAVMRWRNYARSFGGTTTQPAASSESAGKASSG